jgi:regulator of sigma E protease
MSFTEILSIALQMILSLSILVVLHECGHFFPARWFKTRVEKFYLFFDPWFSLFKKKIGDTEYGIGWIPFGGYVKISGMIDESMDKEQMEGPVQPWEFRAKKAWQRLIIMVGGVVVNFILGFFIFAMLLFVYGKSYYKTSDMEYGIAVDSLGMELGLQDGDQILAVGDLEMDRYNPGGMINEIILNNASELTIIRDGKNITVPVEPEAIGMLTSPENKGKTIYIPRYPHKINKVRDGSIAEEMGLKKDDRVISVNGNSTPYTHDFTLEIKRFKNQKVTLDVLRGNDTLSMSTTLDSTGVLGIENALVDEFIPTSRQKYTLAEALPGGVKEGVNFLTNQIKAFGQMFKGKIKATESLGSVFSIASLFDPQWDWEKFWRITAMLSIILGFFNILPIPALDGGYVLFLFWEIITGKKPNDKFMEYVTIAGFIILVALMIFALGLDVTRLFK